MKNEIPFYSSWFFMLTKGVNIMRDETIDASVKACASLIFEPYSYIYTNVF